jgi:hypothetical protein
MVGASSSSVVWKTNFPDILWESWDEGIEKVADVEGGMTEA